MKSEWRALRAGTLVAAVASVLLMLCTMAASAVLARILPQEQLGGYYLLTQSVILLGLLAMLGTNNSLQRLLAVPAALGHWPQVRDVMRRATGLVGLGLLGVALLVAAFWAPVMGRAFDAPQLGSLWALAIVLTLTQVVDELVSVVFRATGRTRLGVALLNLPRQALFVAALATLWTAGSEADLRLVVRLRVAITLLTSAVGVALVVGTLRGRPATADGPPPATVPVARTSIPMMVHGLAAAVRNTLDVWFLGAFVGAADVGVYGAMVQAAGLLALGISVVNLVIPPMLASMHAAGRLAELEALMRRVSTLLAWGGGVLVLGFALFGEELIELLFGAPFRRGYGALLWLALGQALNVAAGSPGWLLQMTGHQTTLMRITLASIAVKLALTWGAVLAFGMEGVAAATCLVTAGQNLATTLLAHRLIGVRTHPYLDPRHALRAR
jgi:O-antigen/teichoic acid export membrane protein